MDPPGGARGSGNAPTPFAQVTPLGILRGNLDSVHLGTKPRAVVVSNASLAWRRALTGRRHSPRGPLSNPRAPVCSAPPTHPPAHDVVPPCLQTFPMPSPTPRQYSPGACRKNPMYNDVLSMPPHKYRGLVITCTASLAWRAA